MTKIVLLFSGVALLVGGIVAATITGSWSTAPLVLSCLGIACLLFRLWLWGQKYRFWQRRSTITGAGAIAKTALVLLAIGIINGIGIGFDRRWDVTENQVYTLGEQSQTIVSNLERPLEVLVFDRNQNPELERLLQNYRRYSDKFQFRYINPEQEIGLAQQFGIQSLGEIHLSYEGKQQKLDLGNVAAGETLTETRLTNGIERIQRDRSIKIYFLQGHGEASLNLVEGGLAQAVNNLKARGYEVKELNLASTGKIPPDASLIAIAGATRKLLAAEVSSIEQYLNEGGNLLLLLTPNTEIGIEAILSNWGIELDNRLVVDGSNAGNAMGFGPAVAIINQYGQHPITESFRNGISLFPEARPLKIIAKPNISAVAIARTNVQTWAESDLRQEQITFDINQDLSGPLNLAIAYNRQQPNPSRLVTFGSTTFVTNGWFEQQLNGDLLLNSISWLVGEDKNPLQIRSKEIANRRINLSTVQTSFISWLALRIMPFLALVGGVYIWRRRK
ncbi:MAG: Gldg family protein [Cyanobacteria bacterium J06623_7]